MDKEGDKIMYSNYVQSVTAQPPPENTNLAAHSELDRQIEEYLANGGVIHKAGPTDSRAYREGGKKRTRKEQIRHRKHLNRMAMINH
jgi:hypothetical protein